jgi:hypothetical protein
MSSEPAATRCLVHLKMSESDRMVLLKAAAKRGAQRGAERTLTVPPLGIEDGPFLRCFFPWTWFGCCVQTLYIAGADSSGTAFRFLEIDRTPPTRISFAAFAECPLRVQVHPCFANVVSACS